MSEVYQERYNTEIRKKTLRYGLGSAFFAIVAIAFFYYYDISELQLEGTLPWRLLGVFGALGFVLFVSVSAWRKQVVLAHLFMLNTFLIMMAGIAYLIFSDPQANVLQLYAVTTGSISVWFVVALIASGAGYLLVYTGGGILLISSMVNLLSLSSQSEGLGYGFVTTIFMMGLFALLYAYNKARSDRAQAFTLYELEASRDRVIEKSQDLQQANANLMTFTRAMSHDLQGPLRRARSFLDLYERQSKVFAAISDDKQEYLELSRKHLARGQEVVKNLLTYAEIGQQQVVKKWVNLNELCLSIVKEQLEALPEDQRVTITYDITSDLYIDEKLCWHLISNLLSNAIKYSGGVAEPAIKLGCHEEGNEAILYIKDNGIGFDDSFKLALGQPFQRLHGQDTSGSGIGLSVVRQIVNLHHGRFWGESPGDSGAIFYCAFPKDP